MASSSIARQISESFIKPKHTSKESQPPLQLTPWDLFVLSHPYLQKGLLFTQLVDMEIVLARLKRSLSVALVHFYSLAGQLETVENEDDQTSSIFIDCNKGPGARFIHATLDKKASEITSPSCQRGVIDSLFDHNDVANHDGHTMPLMTVQVTELIDGVFVACCINHVCADGESYWHFLNAWSDIFMDENSPISSPPVYTRWFIDGRGPIKLPNEFQVRRSSGKSDCESRVFRFSAESIAKLKTKANSECGITNRISSFQALAALLWRCITRARSVPDDECTDCALTFNNRPRLAPPLSRDYFGNSVQMSVASAAARELLQRGLGWAAMKLNEVVASHDDKRVRERIEGWTRNPGGGVYRPGGYRVVFSGSTRFDGYRAEFGMGRAVAVVSGSGNKRDGKVICGRGRDGEGSVELEVCLLEDSMSALVLDQEFVEFVSSVVSLC